MQIPGAESEGEPDERAGRGLNPLGARRAWGASPPPSVWKVNRTSVPGLGANQSSPARGRGASPPPSVFGS